MAGVIERLARSDGLRVRVFVDECERRQREPFAYRAYERLDALLFGRGHDALAATGLSGLHTGAQYQLFVDGPHEMLGLVGLNVSWAHTGRVAALGAPDFTTLSPTFNFGKGFGDLAPSLAYLRPFAVTSNLGFDFPTKTESAGAPNPRSTPLLQRQE